MPEPNYVSEIEREDGTILTIKDAEARAAYEETIGIVSQTYNSADCNLSLCLCQDNGVTEPSTYYMTDQRKMHFQIQWIKNQYKYWNDGVDSYKYQINTLGLIATNNAAKRNELTLSTPPVIGTTDETYIKISVDTEEQGKTAGTYTWQKSSVNVGDVWYIRPHIEYTDLETGMEYTMYGAVYKVTVGVPCTIECATLSCTELTAMLGNINTVLEGVL